VVIYDVNESTGEIYYNDPAQKPRCEDVASFISKWEDENVQRSLISVEVEKRKQTKIQEY
jgi:CRISPR/Cas system-associated endoribonuclease Cas2